MIKTLKSFDTKPHAEYWYAASPAIITFWSVNVSSCSVGSLNPTSLANGTQKFQQLRKFHQIECTQNVFLNFRKLFPEFLPFHSIKLRTGNLRISGRMESAHGTEISGEKFQKIRKLLNFREANHSTESCGNSGMKIKWNGYFQENTFENLSIPHEVGLFFGNSANSRFAIQRCFCRDRSELDTSRKDAYP